MFSRINIITRKSCMPPIICKGLVCTFEHVCFISASKSYLQNPLKGLKNKQGKAKSVVSNE